MADKISIQIKEVSFPLDQAGYEYRSVDRFLDDLAKKVDKLEKENAILHRILDRNSIPYPGN